YFDIKMKNDWMFHTGVIVKSTHGTDGLKTYPLNNPDLDNAFAGGKVKRTFQYFNVPFMMKRKLPKNLFAEGGIMLGLLYNAHDEFYTDIKEDNDLNYKISIKDEYHPLDAGLIAGMGYRFLKGNGMNLGIRYYYGLVDIEIDDSGKSVFNRSLYLTLGIPIGAGKAKEKSENKM
ncbi:MAG: porin family protein, partial [Flavobacterium sp.]